MATKAPQGPSEGGDLTAEVTPEMTQAGAAVICSAYPDGIDDWTARKRAEEVFIAMRLDADIMVFTTNGQSRKYDNAGSGSIFEIASREDV